MTISLDKFFKENGKKIWCSTEGQNLPDYEQFEAILEDRRKKDNKRNVNDIVNEEEEA